jgi:hypothetical protein
MKSIFRIFCLLFLPAIMFGQLPRPYVAGGIDLMPAGYSSTAWQGTAGVEWNPKHLVFDSYAGYDTGKKVNDGTTGNYKGHDRFLRGFVGPRFGLWYAGVGARWSQLSTSNYTKGGSAFAAGSWHPEIGGGRDWNSKTVPLFLRTQLAYMARPSKEVTHYPDGTSCDGCGSGSHGMDFTMWVPSPEHTGHFFFKMNVVIFRFHDSFTDPKNIPLTNQQAANKHLGDSTEFMAGFRF